MQKTKDELQQFLSKIYNKIDEDNRTWSLFIVQFTICYTSSYENTLRKGIVSGVFEQVLLNSKDSGYKFIEICPEIFIVFAHARQIHSIQKVLDYCNENITDQGLQLQGYDLTVDFDSAVNKTTDLVASFGGVEPELKEISYNLDSTRLELLKERGTLIEREKQRKIRQHPKILIVDDERVTLKILEGFAKQYGEVYKVDDAQGALNAYATLFPDILLLDINLGQFSGLDILRTIRKYDKGCHVLMISSYKEARIVREAVEAGASGYLSKPFSANKFKKSMDRWNKNQ